MKLKLSHSLIRVFIITCLLVGIFSTPTAGFFWGGGDACAANNGVNYDIRQVGIGNDEAEITIRNTGRNQGNETVQYLAEGTPIAEKQVGLNPDEETVVTIIDPQITSENYTIITPHDQLGADLEYSGGCEIQEIEGDDGPSNWDIPNNTDTDGSNVLSPVRYTDLWYGITILDENSEQYKILEDSLDENLGNTPGSQFILRARDEIDAGAITSTPKAHTYTWNEQIDEREIENDMDKYIQDTKIDEDSPVVGKTGAEIISIDPHTTFIEPNGPSSLFDTARTIKYINRNPEVTIGATETEYSARSDEIYGTGDKGDPRNKKTEYSIESSTVNKELIVKTPSNPQVDDIIISDAFSDNDITTQDVSIPSKVKAGDPIEFKMKYEILVTEKIGDYARSARPTSNKEGDFIGYDYGSWYRYDKSTKDYSTISTETIERTLYDPQLNVEYNTYENNENNELYVFMNAESTQPIAGFTPQYGGSTTEDTDISQSIKMPNMYFSTSKPRYRGSLSKEDILPVNHGATPTGETPTTESYYADNVRVIGIEGDRGTYSDPENINMPIDSAAVTQVNEVRTYSKYTATNFRKESIRARSIIPNTSVDLRTTQSNIGSSNVSVVDTHITTRELDNGKTRVTLTTTKPSGVNVPTEDYTNSAVNLHVGSDTYTLNTNQNGRITKVVDPTPPVSIRAVVETNQEAAIANDNDVLIGRMASTSINYAPVKNLEGNLLGIITAALRRFLWWFFPAITLLSVVTKAITGEWIPYLN